MPRVRNGESKERTRTWSDCRICGRKTVAKDGICTQTERCLEARKVLREFRRAGRPRSIPVTEVRAILPGSTMSARELGQALGYGHKAISRCAKYRCMLVRRWQLPEIPLYYPTLNNWRQCRAACLLLSYPEQSIMSLSRMTRLKPNTLFTDIRLLKAKFVWCDRLHPQSI